MQQCLLVQCWSVLVLGTALPLCILRTLERRGRAAFQQRQQQQQQEGMPEARRLGEGRLQYSYQQHAEVQQPTQQGQQQEQQREYWVGMSLPVQLFWLSSLVWLLACIMLDVWQPHVPAEDVPAPAELASAHVTALQLSVT